MILGLLMDYSGLLDHGLGIVSVWDDVMGIPSYNDWYKQEARRYKSLPKYIPENLYGSAVNHISTMEKPGLKP